MVKTLMQDERFLDGVLMPLVLDVFADNRNLDTSGKHIHVTLASRRLCAGSLRETLLLAIEVLVSQALAHILRALDHNFGLVPKKIKRKRKKERKRERKKENPGRSLFFFSFCSVALFFLTFFFFFAFLPFFSFLLFSFPFSPSQTTNILRHVCRSRPTWSCG